MFAKYFKASTAAIALASLGLLPLQAAEFPYENDFSGTGSNTAFTNTNAGVSNSWTLVNGSYRNSYANSSYIESTTSVGLTGVTADFVMETQFTVTSAGTANSNNSTLGFGLFGNSDNFASTDGASFYLADFQFLNNGNSGLGTLRILSLGDAGGFSQTAGAAKVSDSGSANLAIALGITYTLRLEGWYSESGLLTMSLGLYDSLGLTQIGTSANATDSSPLTGEYFGYRNRVGIQGGSTVIDFDNFGVVPAVPEPAHWAAFGAIAALGVLAQRRRLRA